MQTTMEYAMHISSGCQFLSQYFHNFVVNLTHIAHESLQRCRNSVSNGALIIPCEMACNAHFLCIQLPFETLSHMKYVSFEVRMHASRSAKFISLKLRITSAHRRFCCLISQPSLECSIQQSSLSAYFPTEGVPMSLAINKYAFIEPNIPKLPNRIIGHAEPWTKKRHGHENSLRKKDSNIINSTNQNFWTIISYSKIAPNFRLPQQKNNTILNSSRMVLLPN